MLLGSRWMSPPVGPLQQWKPIYMAAQVINPLLAAVSPASRNLSMRIIAIVPALYHDSTGAVAVNKGLNCSQNKIHFTRSLQMQTDVEQRSTDESNLCTLLECFWASAPFLKHLE